jgi:uncharacterized membrane protein YdjX (TVP38/TMEM64 family)
MFKTRSEIIKLVIVCLVVTAITLYFLGVLDTQNLKIKLQNMGIFAPILYIFVYTVATIFILPSTAL